MSERDPTGSFEDWVAPHYAAMARVAARLSPGEARDDVLQEALAAAWRRRETYDPGRGTVRGWLVTIVVNQARHSWRRPRTESMDTLAAHPAAPVASSPEHRADLAAAIERLPPRQRLAVNLRYYADLSVAQVAEIMGISAGTVKSTLSDARATLRRDLGKDYR